MKWFKGRPGLDLVGATIGDLREFVEALEGHADDLYLVTTVGKKPNLLDFDMVYLQAEVAEPA